MSFQYEISPEFGPEADPFTRESWVKDRIAHSTGKHAATHQAGGSDPILLSASQIGALSNYSTAAQTTAAGTRTYITGSAIIVLTGDLKVGMCARWTISVTKNAAGSTAATWAIAVGTAGTTADTDRVSFTKPTGTNVADEGTVTISMIVRATGASSGVLVGQFSLVHNLQTTGHAVTPSVVVNTVSAAFDTTGASGAVVIGITATPGTDEVYTFQLVQAEAWNA